MPEPDPLNATAPVLAMGPKPAEGIVDSSPPTCPTDSIAHCAQCAPRTSASQGRKKQRWDQPTVKCIECEDGYKLSRRGSACVLLPGAQLAGANSSQQEPGGVGDLAIAPAATYPPCGTYYYYQNTGHLVGYAYDCKTKVNYKSACAGAQLPLLYFDGVATSCRNRNNCQFVKRMGPLPVGKYTIGAMSSSGWQGWSGLPYWYPLNPYSTNLMYGRSGFYIHGGDCTQADNPKPGSSYLYYKYAWRNGGYVASGSFCDKDYYRNTEGCVMIPDKITRYQIKSWSTLVVYAQDDYAFWW